MEKASKIPQLVGVSFGMDIIHQGPVRTVEAVDISSCCPKVMANGCTAVIEYGQYSNGQWSFLLKTLYVTGGFKSFTASLPHEHKITNRKDLNDFLQLSAVAVA